MYISQIDRVIGTKVVNSALGTKQTLYTVPTGRNAIIIGLVFRTPSQNFTLARVSAGYNAAANDVLVLSNLDSLTTTQAIFFGTDYYYQVTGTSGAVLGVDFVVTDTGTVTVDVIGYEYP